MYNSFPASTPLFFLLPRAATACFTFNESALRNTHLVPYFTLPRLSIIDHFISYQYPRGRHARRYCSGTSIPVMEKRRLEETKLAGEEIWRRGKIGKTGGKGANVRTKTNTGWVLTRSSNNFESLPTA